MKKSEVKRKQLAVRSQESKFRSRKIEVRSSKRACHSDPAVAGKESPQLLSAPIELHKNPRRGFIK